MAGPANQELPQHLSAGRKIHVIISVLSGTQQAQVYYDSTLAPLLQRYGVEYTTHTTKSAQTIVELTQNTFVPDASNGVEQTIILLSGDGGVIDLINTLASSIPNISKDQPIRGDYVRPVICLLPQGTANALAWSSQIASNPLEILTKGTPKPIPMFQAKFSPGAKLVVNEGADLEDITTVSGADNNPLLYGAVVFSWGLHASLVSRSDTAEYRKHGIERFRMVAGELLEENHAYNGVIKIQVPGSEGWEPVMGSESKTSTTPTNHEQGLSHDKTSYVAVTLVSNLEEKYRISPHQKPLSNLMHVIFIAHRSKEELGELTFLPYQDGKHVEDPRVVYKPIEALRIEVNENDGSWRDICVDGKIVRLEEGGWAEVSRLSSTSVADVVAQIE